MTRTLASREQLAQLSAIACGRLDRHAGLIESYRAAPDADVTPWYRIENAKDDDDDDSADIYVYAPIGGWFGIAASDFAKDLAALDVSRIRLRLNSPGGSVFDGIAIHNLLVTHRADVHVMVDGIAASIASVIAMAGDQVTMGRGTEIMIHDPSAIVWGNSRDMREMAELLDKLAEDIAGFYAHRAGGTRAEWRERMTAETWYSAEEAIDAGLADDLAPAGNQGAGGDKGKDDDEDEATDSGARLHDLSAYRYAGRDRAPAPAARRDLGRGQVAASLSDRTRAARARAAARRKAAQK